MRIDIDLPVFGEGCLGSQREQALKVLEEASELCEAAKLASAGEDPWWNHMHRLSMLEELADVMQALVNLVYVFGIEEVELEYAENCCKGRNEARERY